MKTKILTIITCSFLFSCGTKGKVKTTKAGELIIEKEDGKDVAKKYYKDGLKQTQGEITDSTKRNGNWKYWYENGTLWSECEYKDGIKQGVTKVYFKTGELKYKGFYTKNKPSGTWTFYNIDGSILKEVKHD